MRANQVGDSIQYIYSYIIVLPVGILSDQMTYCPGKKVILVDKSYGGTLFNLTIPCHPLCMPLFTSLSLSVASHDNPARVRNVLIGYSYYIELTMRFLGIFLIEPEFLRNLCLEKNIDWEFLTSYQNNQFIIAEENYQVYRKVL